MGINSKMKKKQTNKKRKLKSNTILSVTISISNKQILNLTLNYL